MFISYVTRDYFVNFQKWIVRKNKNKKLLKLQIYYVSCSA